MTEVKNNKAFDFLLYSYFGIKESDLKPQSKKVPYICAKRAYLDLARTVKYRYSSSELKEMKSKKSSEEDKDKANNFIESKNNLIKNICENILPPIETKEGEISFESSDFDKWHKAKCEEIINFMNNSIDKSNTKILKKKENFTIGQAQKWVNMTLKYLWLLNALPTGVKPEYLHVPIDSYIIEIAYYNKNKFENALGLLEEKPKESWSKLPEYEEYFKIQEAIRKAIKTNATKETIPIKWESLAWIEVAEKQANK